MKSLRAAGVLLVLALSAFAEPELIAPGKYLLITNENAELAVTECEITDKKEGMYITFPPLVEHPECSLKPVRIFFFDGQGFQFSLGPADYVRSDVLDLVANSMSVYIGGISDHKITGVRTTVIGGGDPGSVKFLLYQR